MNQHRAEAAELQQFYREQLLQDVVPFWLNSDLIDKKIEEILCILGSGRAIVELDDQLAFTNRICDRQKNDILDSEGSPGILRPESDACTCTDNILNSAR